MKQHIQFLTAPDGVQIAYSIMGSGTPLVKAGNWLGHLEYEMKSPIWRHWHEELAGQHTLVRHDRRGGGLSDWAVTDFSLERSLTDLELVVDRLRLDRFALLGVSQGAALAITYAARHPDRVSHLIIYGGFARGAQRRGSPNVERTRAAVITLTKQGWGTGNPAFRGVFGNRFMPDAGEEQLKWLDELQRVSTTPDNAVSFLQASAEVDVVDRLAEVRAPALVLHCEKDVMVPLAEGEIIAAGIPNATLVKLSGKNHLPVKSEPAWRVCLDTIHTFLGDDPVLAPSASDSARRSASALGAGDEVLAAGECVGSYRVIGRLANETSRVLFKAHAESTASDVVLRALPPSKGKEERDALMAAVEKLSALSHPSIACVLGFVSHGDQNLLVMEHVPGESFEHVVAKSPLPAGEVARVGAQLALALSAGHASGVNHLALRPAHIRVLMNGNLRVLDFGLTSLPSQAHTTASLRSLGDSPTKKLAKVVPYYAPEQLRGEAGDARTDIYALGVILFQLAAGRLPFDALVPTALAADVLYAQTPRLRQVVPSAPAWLERVIAKAMARDPADRFESAEQLERALLRGDSNKGTWADNLRALFTGR